MIKVAEINCPFPTLENGLPVDSVALYYDGDDYVVRGANTGAIAIPYPDLRAFLRANARPAESSGWLICGLPADCWQFASFDAREYLP